MNRDGHLITRRDFINRTAKVSFAIAAGLSPGGVQKQKVSAATTVVLVRDQDVVDSRRRINGEILSRMLDKGMAALGGVDDGVLTWKRMFSPEDVVGVKSNVWGPLPTPSSLEHAIVRRLQEAGVQRKNIAVDDRGVRQNRVFHRATAIINVRPMRTHHWAGVGSCLKNYIMFAENPPDYHPDSCANLGALWQLPAVKGKTRLNILVLLTPLFHGIGPHHFDLKYTWPYRGLVLGTDPVAVDSVGLRIIELHRLEYFGRSRPLWPPAKHIALADKRFHIGTADLNKIRIIKLGWLDGVLI